VGLDEGRPEGQSVDWHEGSRFLVPDLPAADAGDLPKAGEHPRPVTVHGEGHAVVPFEPAVPVRNGWLALRALGHSVAEWSGEDLEEMAGDNGALGSDCCDDLRRTEGRRRGGTTVAGGAGGATICRILHKATAQVAGGSRAYFHPVE
jgi:hypothetical protein